MALSDVSDLISERGFNRELDEVSNIYITLICSILISIFNQRVITKTKLFRARERDKGKVKLNGCSLKYYRYSFHSARKYLAASFNSWFLFQN